MQVNTERERAKENLREKEVISHRLVASMKSSVFTILGSKSQVGERSSLTVSLTVH